ncbi:MAG: YihY/virulence factor BrkB family protein [Chlorobi bacterium]|nr:YihY/virulence factor BrkB family protein [Chlorobiota bacterium]
MKKKIQKFKDFINNELWSIDITKKPKPMRALINFLRTVSLGFKGYKEDKLSVNASALTYFTLLSIVPVLALGFGIAKGFGMDKMLEEEITASFQGQEQVLNYILNFTRTMLETAKGGIIAGLGFILLLWSVIKLLSNIESIFNRVWDIRKSRSIIRKFTDYMTIMLLGPIFMIMASSTTVFISTQLSHFSQTGMFDFATPLFLKFAKIIPFVIVWIAFTILYLIMPNTKVKFRSAVIAGITAGTIFQIFQGLYIYFQSGATRINAVYGSFAALPLFLIWLQTAWFVVLLGAEISFAVQNIKLKGSGLLLQKLSIHYQKKIALFLLLFIIDFFKKGKKAPTLQELSTLSTLPVPTTEYILNNLVKAGIVSQVLLKDKHAFQPAMSLENLTVAKVINNYENFGKDYSKYVKNTVYAEIEMRLKNIKEFQSKSEDNILIKEIEL